MFDFARSVPMETGNPLILPATAARPPEKGTPPPPPPPSCGVGFVLMPPDTTKELGSTLTTLRHEPLPSYPDNPDTNRCQARNLAGCSVRPRKVVPSTGFLLATPRASCLLSTNKQGIYCLSPSLSCAVDTEHKVTDVVAASVATVVVCIIIFVIWYRRTSAQNCKGGVAFDNPLYGKTGEPMRLLQPSAFDCRCESCVYAHRRRNCFVRHAKLLLGFVIISAD